MTLLHSLYAAGGQFQISSPLGKWAQNISGVVAGLRAHGRPFLTQESWYVDAASGRDTNGGTSWDDALTLPELARRTNGVFGPGVSRVNVYLRGEFSEPLVLQPVLSNLTAGVLVQGQTENLHQGQVTTFVADSAVTGTRARLFENGVDLSVFIGKRLRVLTGPSAGSIAFVAAADGQAVFTTHFMKFGLATGTSSANPAPGDAYVVENLLTSVPNYKARVLGGNISSVASVKFNGSATSSFEVDGGYGTVFGCDYAPPSVMLLTGSHSQTCCRYSSGNYIALLGSRYLRQLSCCCEIPIFIDDGAYVAAYYNTHQGPSATLSVSTGATLEDLGHRGFFGVGGAAAFSVQYVGRYFQLHTTDLLWGSGNTASYILKVTGGSSVALLAAPIATGTGKDALIGGVEKTWAQLPYIDVGVGTNNSGAMVVFQ